MVARQRSARKSFLIWSSASHTQETISDTIQTDSVKSAKKRTCTNSLGAIGTAAIDAGQSIETILLRRNERNRNAGRWLSVWNTLEAFRTTPLTVFGSASSMNGWRNSARESNTRSGAERRVAISTTKKAPSGARRGKRGGAKRPRSALVHLWILTEFIQNSCMGRVFFQNHFQKRQRTSNDFVIKL